MNVEATHAPSASGAPTDWSTWAAGERENFFDAIARHRRAVWRVTLAATVANVLVAVVVATLMAPLFYGALGLVLDVINIVVPAPNLFAGILEALGPMVDAPEKVSLAGWMRLLALAAVPGLVWMAGVLLILRRMLRVSSTFDAGEMAARPPSMAVLAEQQLANVIGEMAIAASVPAPRVLVLERSLLNAAVFGRDEQHATVVVSQGLLERLDRAEMQGVAAHLISSVANGDMAIGLRAALTLSLFGLITYLGTVLVNGEGAGRKIARVVRATLMPTAAGARRLAADLADPFVDADEVAGPTKRSFGADASAGASGSGTAGAGVGAANAGAMNPHPAGSPTVARSAAESYRGRTEPQTRWEKVRPFLWLPLAGPLVMSGFFGGMVSSFVLGPLLSLAWRQRKYMADATAVRLTRDPNTLGEALEKMSAAGEGAAFAPWTAHLSVVPLGRRQSNLVGGGVVPMFPSLDRRLRRLGRFGAQLTRAPRRMPLKIVLIITPLFVIAGVLIAIVLPLLVWLSLALTMLFTAFPLGALHLLLRAIGH